MSKFVYEGVEFKSKAQAGVEFVNAGVSIREAAVILGCTYHTIYNALDKGKVYHNAVVKAVKLMRVSKTKRFEFKDIAKATGLAEDSIIKTWKRIKAKK